MERHDARPSTTTGRGAVLLAVLLAGAPACAPTGSPVEPTDPGGPSGGGTSIPAAALLPPPGRIVHGMGQWEEYNQKLLAALPAGVHPASELLFVDIGDTPRGWRPETIAAMLQTQVAAGLVPHVDIALRGLQPTPAELAALDDKLYAVDDDVASGTKYDGRILDLVTIIGALPSPVMVRIGGEFSGAWNGYHPYAYPKAFRKIVGMFRDAGVTNAAFVWCYMPAAPGDFDATDGSGAYRWYPGADVIDWYGIDWFDAGDFTGSLADRGTETRNGRTRRFLDMAVADDRPVVVAESSPARYDLSDPAQAEAAWQEWFAPYFQVLAERPEIRWFHLISYDWGKAAYYQALGWENNDLTASPELLERLVEELSRAKYLHAPEKGLIGA